MRILALFTDAFGGRGGIAKFNRDLLTAFSAHPDCTELVALPRLMVDNPGSVPSRISWRTDGLGGKLDYIRAVLRVARGSTGGTQPRWTKQNPVQAGFDLVICGHLNLLPLAVLARRLAKGTRARARGQFGPTPYSRSGSANRTAPSPPLVLIAHGVEAWRPHCSRWSDFLVNHIDALIAVSAFTRDRFLNWAPLENRPSFILPNCTDPARFRPGRKRLDLLQRYGLGGPVLMTLGRLCSAERYKGVDEVLELMPALTKESPKLSYLVAGDGDDRARLAAKARSLHLAVAEPSTLGRHPANVIFAGHIPENEKPDHYRLADAFVMPGWGEGFGVVYLEALACGIPVVGSTLDASREVLQDCESAFLVDPRGPDDIWNGICSALAAPRGTVPARVRAFARSNFNRQAHGLLEELLGLGAGKTCRQKILAPPRDLGLSPCTT